MRYRLPHLISQKIEAPGCSWVAARLGPQISQKIRPPKTVIRLFWPVASPMLRWQQVQNPNSTTPPVWEGVQSNLHARDLYRSVEFSVCKKIYSENSISNIHFFTFSYAIRSQGLRPQGTEAFLGDERRAALGARDPVGDRQTNTGQPALHLVWV